MEWSTPRRPALLPVGFVEPCLPSVRATAPRGREWVHEIKFNGIRLIVRRDGKRARVYTRRGFDWTGRFPWIEDTPNQSAMPHRELHMPVIEVRFKLEKETKGALRYQEVDEKGEVIEQAWAKIGTLYIRKSAFERGAAFPQLLRVTVETAGP